MTDADPPSGPAPQTGALFDAPPLPELERMIEAILFASAEPMTRAEIEERLPHGSDASAALESVCRRYGGRGVNLVRVGSAWAFRTAPDLGFLMRREAQETRRLSRAAIETLAIIAYHQPATRAEIEEIRGVSASRGTLDLLLELAWIKLGRRRDTPGRPVTFVTTQLFLDHFGLESARDLPGLKELRESGLLDNRPGPGPRLDPEDEEDDAATGELFLDTDDDLFADNEPRSQDQGKPSDPAG
ncbi:MAG: SMC-Scp complex subunit ScpB [Pseudomonadota bacterium]